MMPAALGLKPAWCDVPVPVISGLGDTRRKRGEAYAVRKLGDLLSTPVSSVPKLQALAFLPSTYSGHDARAHDIQRAQGKFVALVGDVDRGNHSLMDLRAALSPFVGEAAWSAYSTASATADDRRWRVVVPLADLISFDQWYDAQMALCAHMMAHGIAIDACASRPGQIAFLPNVPPEKRDAAGMPVFYEAAGSGPDCPGLRLDIGLAAEGMATIERQRIADEAARAGVKEAMARRPQRVSPDGSVIDAFNAANDLASLLEGYGYERSPRDGRDWRSPHQTSGSYATRVVERGKWVSLSGSDCDAGLGERHASGCYGDAFDLFVHYEHGGDRKSAWKAACEEQGRNRPMRAYDGNDGHEWSGQANDNRDADGQASSQSSPIVATPFVWRDAASIPPRKWLYGRHLIRKFLSLDIAPGGVGKSSVKLVEALAMTTGRPLLGKDVHEGPLRVWLYNLEDPAEETERRIHAAALHYGIREHDVGGRLFVDSGRDQPMCVAEETANGARIIRPMVEAVIAQLRERHIDVLSVDPFVSSHAINENDNRAIDMVAKEWSRIADECDCAINLVHHVRKSNGAEVTAESSRGAVSLIGAARSVVVYNRMSKEEAKSASVPSAQRGFYFRTENDKANLAPPEAADWFRMNNVDLPNGDSVGVACPWQWPDAFDGISTADLYKVQLAINAGEWGDSSQAKDWAGHAVASALGLDVGTQKERIKSLLKTWTDNGAFEVAKRSTSKGREKPFLVVGSWVDPTTLPTSSSGVGKVG